MSERRTVVIEIPLDAIEVSPGRRKLRGVHALAESMQDMGLLNPITVAEIESGGYRLIAGAHRFAAAGMLGWEEISAVVLDLPEIDLQIAEIDENLCRNDLSELERAEQFAKRKELFLVKWPETKQHVAGAKASNDAQKNHTNATDNLSVASDEAEEPHLSFAAQTAAKTGVSERTVRRSVQIATDITPEIRDAIRNTPLADSKTDLIDLARLKPEKQAEVVARVASGSATVKDAIGAIKQDAKRALAAELRAQPLPTPTGPFGVIVADPPWPYLARTEDPTHRGNTEYPLMTMDEILALPVGELAADDAILWLWVTNAFMRQAFQCLDAWGFEEKTILTWTKDRLGVGNWLRNITEHCVMAVRGRPLVTLTNQTTELRAPRREHSRKPEIFWGLVDSLCPDSRRIEMFSREARPGWQQWGSETEKFVEAETE